MTARSGLSWPTTRRTLRDERLDYLRAGAEPQAGAVSPRQGAVRGLRRCQRRRQELGGAVQGCGHVPEAQAPEGDDRPPHLPGTAREPHHSPLRDAALRCSQQKGSHCPVQRQQEAYHIPQRLPYPVPLLRQGKGCFPVPGHGGGHSVRGRGHPPGRGHHREDQRLCPWNQRPAQAHLLHLQPRRARAQLDEAAVHRPGLQAQ